MTETRYWWPLELSAELEDELAAHKIRLRDFPVQFDAGLSRQVERSLVDFLARPVQAIVARDSLPYLGHVFVGWGNATVNGAPLLDRVASFVHQDPSGKPYIYQCHPEGDFHPWQTFAYTMMAGIDPEARVGALPFTLREIAQHSTVIRTSAMDDLGHLMYAHAALGLPDTLTFEFNGTPLTLADMMEEAIKAHHFGPFYVCRKFHLTEGLCAIAATYPAFARYQPVAQKFLDGQLEVMLTLSLLVAQLEAVADASLTMDQSRIPALRKAMLIGALLENHLYSAGHVIELAALAMRMGYQVSDVHRSAIHHLLNHFNGCVQRSMTRFAPTAAFLPLGHYRRAMSLYANLHAAAAGQDSAPRAALTGYWADFDASEGTLPELPAAPVDALYNRAAHSAKVRPFFQSVLDEFAQGNSTGMDLYGGFDHFRRLHPDGWPRQMHFEFLDYADRVGVELHFENPDLLPLMDAVAAAIPALQEKFPGIEVHGLRRVDRSQAKIRLYHDAATGPVDISKSMQEFVAFMSPIVSAELHNPAHGIQRSRLDASAAAH
ncbi:hypothetical protein PO883_00795 [Massilia sp. DJPM01]|uniref:hypothetical protein n=1 Tax=Massilia sp. DJPM01 TaxID=3024404 RepID=UPI00259E8EF2|nr:hypothetical protein [Massilia sp. DJPM01]MDM5175749.1 hypothetical protein [Massilia sp. DJPM01]